MYHGLITAFSTIYRKGKSPYNARWSLEKNGEAFGNDAKLMKMFQKILDEEIKYCT